MDLIRHHPLFTSTAGNNYTCSSLAYLTTRGERDERKQRESKHKDEIIETLG